MIERKSSSAQQQRAVIEADPFLFYLYRESIEIVERLWKRHSIKADGPKHVLEIGAAGGITKKIRPNWLTLDVREDAGIDYVINYGNPWPIPDRSIEVIFMQDVLHHVKDLPALVHEVDRVLTDKGIVVCREPYWSLPAQIVWRFLHPEDFNVRRVPNFLSSKDEGSPMDGNQAIAWLLCARYMKLRKERASLRSITDHFEISNSHAVNGIAFALSGGSNFTTRVNRKFLLVLHKVERRFHLWNRLFGFSFFFVLKKTEDTYSKNIQTDRNKSSN